MIVTFEESVFSLAPACLLLIVSPWRLYYLRRSTPKTTKSWIHLWSLVGIVWHEFVPLSSRLTFSAIQPVFLVLGALQATLVALFSQEHAEYCSLLIASSTLQLCATIVLTLLSHSEHRNAVRPSMVISSYLISTSILDAARARTHGLMPGRSTVTGVLIAIVLLKVVAVALETRQKTSVLSSEYCALSPESRSNIFSRAFFLWLNPVLSMGFRGVISSQDLPTIYEKLTSEDLATRVRSGWIKSRFTNCFEISYTQKMIGKKKGNNALMYHVLLSFPYELFLVFVGSTALVGLNICYPFLIQEAVAFLESPHASLNVGYGLIGGFFCVSLAVAVSTSTFSQGTITNR
jgi:ATP-binding cassette subfamily C (CFTR/MRP) protein 1